VLLGDGRALVQSRSRSCPSDDFNCDLRAMPWAVGAQQRCSVGENFSQLEDCVTADYSCNDVNDMLDSVRGAGGAGGSAGGGAEAGRAGEAAE